MLKEMKKILTITGGAWKFILLLFLRSPFGAASTIVYANFLGRAFDAAENGMTVSLNRVCLLFLIQSICLFLYNGAVWCVYAPFAVRMEKKLRVKAFERISSFSYEKIESSSTGEWITNLNADVEAPFSQPLHFPGFFGAVVSITVSAVFLWRADPGIFGWVMLFVIPHIVISQLIIARAMPGLTEKSLEAKAKNTDGLSAFITCADVSALYGSADYLMKKFEESSIGLLKANMKIYFKKAFGEAILPLFGVSGYFVLLYISSGWIADGAFTFGGLTAAFQYRGGVLLGSFTLINSAVAIKASMAGVRRINRLHAPDTSSS